MQQYLGVLSSDTLNRDGYIIIFEALENGVASNALEGMPSLIDHDFHRPLGWIFPFGIFIEPKISKTIGNFFVCDDDSDSNIIYPKINAFWQHKNYEACKEHFNEFKELLKDNFSEKGRFIDKGCVAYNQQNVAESIYPELFNKVDKDGLLYLDDVLVLFEYIGCGIFKNKADNFCVFCHQYFKRSLSLINNYNTYFLDEFIKLNKNKAITLRIAIDKNIIGLSKTYHGSLEFDYWWGPKFNDDISEIQNGVTRYEMQEQQKFYNGILGTEFWWKTDEREKVLEVEEIRETPSLGIDEKSFGCRYIHSIYNLDRQEFIHFDGAIRLYSEDGILQRWDNSINKAGKNTDYTKLFRIDGKLTLADWKKLCILYYKGNPLLFEYFGAKEEYESLGARATNQNPVNKYLPYKISKEDGIRLFVSYHNKQEDYSAFDRKIINPDIIKFQNGDVLNILEYDIIEIEKFLKRRGEKIEYPNDISFVKPFDYYTNYPIILHGSRNIHQALRITLASFKAILQKQNLHLNKTICFTLGWEMEQHEARLSVFGKSTEIVKWLDLNENIPVEYKEFREWLVLQKDWIYNNYKYSEQDFSSLLRDDGIIYIKRKSIEHDRVAFPNEDDDNYFEVNTRGNDEMDTLVKNETIYPSYLGLIKKAICTKTGEDYFTSNTSKYLDDGVKMAIEKIEFLGFFWTDEQYH